MNFFWGDKYETLHIIANSQYFTKGILSIPASKKTSTCQELHDILGLYGSCWRFSEILRKKKYQCELLRRILPQKQQVCACREQSSIFSHSRLMLLYLAVYLPAGSPVPPAFCTAPPSSAPAQSWKVTCRKSRKKATAVLCQLRKPQRSQAVGGRLKWKSRKFTLAETSKAFSEC